MNKLMNKSIGRRGRCAKFMYRFAFDLTCSRGQEEDGDGDEDSTALSVCVCVCLRRMVRWPKRVL